MRLVIYDIVEHGHGVLVIETLYGFQRPIYFASRWEANRYIERWNPLLNEMLRDMVEQVAMLQREGEEAAKPGARQTAPTTA